jgi:Spondin_N.
VAGSAAALSLAGCLGIGDSGSDDESDNAAAGTNTTDSEESSSDGADTQRTFTVRIENVAPTDFYPADSATGGQIWFTPGAFSVHSGENPIFSVGEPASIGLEAVAEAGPPSGFADEPGLVDELTAADAVSTAGAFTPAETVADPNDPMGEVPGAPPIAPGGAFEFEVQATPGDRLSFATMYVPSNDLFVSPRPAIELFNDGEPVSGDVTDTVGLFDAGTELNGRPGFDPVSAPLQANNGGAAAGPQQGVVHPANLTNDGFEYADASSVAQVTVTSEGSGTFTVRIENVAPTDFYPADSATGGQIWLTPGAYAVFADTNPVFTIGEPASVGLEAVAEAGPPSGFADEPGLVDELATADNATDAGAFTPAETVADPNDPMGEVPGAPPIAPGGAFEFEVQATPGDRLSFATMYVPSNDIFLSSAGGIELFDGGDPITADVTDAVDLFDAGTELNGRPGFDPVSAPLQANNGGAAAGPEEGRCLSSGPDQRRVYVRRPRGNNASKCGSTVITPRVGIGVDTSARDKTGTLL